MRKYNQKLDYLITRHMCNLENGYDEPSLRNVYNKKSVPRTEYEHRIIKMSLIYELLINGNYQEAYQKLYQKDIPAQYHEIVDFARKTIADVVIMEVPEIEFAVLLFNAIRIEQNQIPLFFHMSELKSLQGAVNRKDSCEVNRIIEFAVRVSERMNQTNNITTREEIIARLRSLEKPLNQHEIIGMYLYGSVQKGTFNQYSDVDLIVVTTRYEVTKEYQFLMHGLIEELAEIRIDLIILTKEEEKKIGQEAIERKKIY